MKFPEPRPERIESIPGNTEDLLTVDDINTVQKEIRRLRRVYDEKFHRELIERDIIPAKRYLKRNVSPKLTQLEYEISEVYLMKYVELLTEHDQAVIHLR